MKAQCKDKVTKNIGVIFKFKGDTYKKVATKIEVCDGCITEQDTELCYAAEDCEGIVVHKYHSWIKTFKEL